MSHRPRQRHARRSCRGRSADCPSGYFCRRGVCQRPTSGLIVDTREDAVRRVEQRRRAQELQMSRFGFCVALVFVAYILLRLYFAARAPPVCAAGAATRVEAANRAVSRKASELGLTLGDPARLSSASATLKDFLEQLTFNWTDKERILDAPPHAVSLRLQGSDPVAVAAVVDEMLDALLGPECRRTQVLSIDLGTTGGREAAVRVGSFLSAAKRDNEDELAVVLLRGCHQRAANRAAMVFKDSIYMRVIPTDGSAVPSRAVAFIFLGGDLPGGRECHTTDIESHDTQNGWDDNVVGRIALRARLCSAV